MWGGAVKIKLTNYNSSKNVHRRSWGAAGVALAPAAAPAPPAAPPPAAAPPAAAAPRRRRRRWRRALSNLI